MRSLVTLALFILSSPLVWAGTPADNKLQTFLDANQCGNRDGLSVSAQSICNDAIVDYCANGSAPGCNGAGSSRPVVEWGNSKESVDAAYPKIEAECSKGSEMVQTCCSGNPASCDISASVKGTNASHSLPTSAAPSVDPGLGANQAAGQSKDLMQNLATWKSAVTGSCKSKKFSCSYRCGSAADALEKKNISGCTTCSEKIQALRGYASRCEQANERVAGETADAFDKVSSAGTSKDLSGDGTTPANGDKGTTTTADGKTKPQSIDSSSNSLGSGMMQGLSAMSSVMQALGQQQAAQTAATTATDAASTTPDCSNPNIVDPYGRCPATAATAAAASTSALPVNFAGAQPQSVKGSINVGHNPNDALGASGVDPSYGGGQANQATAGVVPNGGGGIPGNSGSGSPASLGGAGSSGAMMMSAGKATDIMHGEKGGGGYSQTVANMGSAGTTGSGSWSGYGKNDQPENFNFADYLPGHTKYAGRELAGGNIQRVQIQPREVNIWSRISDHIQARCTQGMLRDCVP